MSQSIPRSARCLGKSMAQALGLLVRFLSKKNLNMIYKVVDLLPAKLMIRKKILSFRVKCTVMFKMLQIR